MRGIWRFRIQSVLGVEGGVVISVYHYLCNGSHTAPQTDQEADEADGLQHAPLG